MYLPAILLLTEEQKVHKILATRTIALRSAYFSTRITGIYTYLFIN